MKKNRKKQWEQECAQGIREYEKESGMEYDYYGKINKKEKIDWKDNWNVSHGVRILIRWILGIGLLLYSIFGIDIFDFML